MMLFKSVFRLQMHQNDFFSELFFIYDINTSKPLKNIKKKIILMFFQVKCTFETRLNTVLNAKTNSVHP